MTALTPDPLSELGSHSEQTNDTDYEHAGPPPPVTTTPTRPASRGGNVTKVTTGTAGADILVAHDLPKEVAKAAGRKVTDATINGKVPTIPPLVEHNFKLEADELTAMRGFDFPPLADFQDLTEFRYATSVTLQRMFTLTNVLRDWETKLAETETLYQSQLRRARLTITGRTVGKVEDVAMLACEEAHANVVAHELVVADVKRQIQMCRAYLDALRGAEQSVRTIVDKEYWATKR